MIIKGTWLLTCNACSPGSLSSAFSNPLLPQRPPSPLLPCGDTGEVDSLHLEEEGRTSSLQNRKAINSIVHKPPGLWSSVTGVRHTQTLFISLGALITLCNHTCARCELRVPHHRTEHRAGTRHALDRERQNRRGHRNEPVWARGSKMAFSYAQVPLAEAQLWSLEGGPPSACPSEFDLGPLPALASPQFPHL